jgi:predicted regulator of Ras-like GTPase activity (Roadblock/LC7/MglB family)
MKAAIAPLASLPGVTLAMLVSQDGMPIVVPGEHRVEDSEEDAEDPRLEDADALAALAAGWAADLTRAAAPISWSAPRYLVLRAARGSLLAMQVPRALIVVVLGPGIRPTDFRLPMESTAARIERGLRGNAQRAAAAAQPTGETPSEPEGIFPERRRASDADLRDGQSTRKNGASQPHGPTGE